MKSLKSVLWLCWILILVLLYNPPFGDGFGRRLIQRSAVRVNVPSPPPPPKPGNGGDHYR
ncbi:hypothetical protein TIFTF001_015317 [Ficus carica]|uniref:Uncharacterized protein n=1 Tax=Ficus carica TaxID=3494 RepID=A0AA88D6F6_FICCA|nr:hypothetical protein TIFTF001_015317 [Ficus carica]